MGALFLTVGAGSRRPEAERVLEDQGFARPDIVSTDAFELVVYPRHVDEHASLVRFDNGDFAASVGTLVIDGRRDREALELAYQRSVGDPRALDGSALGCFALVVCRNGTLHVTSDPVGSYALYLDERTGTLSSSFLALVETMPRLTMRRQPVYEYVFNGGVTGDETFVDEIRRLPVRGTYELAGGERRVHTSTPVLPDRDTRPRADQLAETSALLEAGMREIAQAFDGQMTLGLTGGYDSRLVLALARHQGLRPRVFVYRAGGVKPHTVEIARELAELEGLEFEAVQRDALPMPAPEELPAVVERNVLDFDGSIYHGLFVHAVDRQYRRHRGPAGTVSLHGANGEVFRNPLRLPDRPLEAMDVVRAFFLKLDRRMCSPLFDRREYAEAIGAKLRARGDAPEGKLPREVVEWLAGSFRVRDHSGRENSLSNWSGATMTPFFEGRVIRQGFRIPATYKAHGTFEADLIRLASPRIAGVRSQYGHDFMTSPPLRRRVDDFVWEQLLYPRMRPALHEWNARQKAKSGETRPWLSNENVDAVLPDGVQRVAALFDLDAPMEYLVRARLLSVEVLARRMGGRLATEWGG